MAQPPAIVATLVRAIPAEHDAAFVAQVGERGRITSRAGSVDIGSAALTVAAIDELNASIFPPDCLRALQESGLAQFDFALPGVDGAFTAVAGSNSDDRWLDIRRRMTAIPAAVQPAARPTAAPQATVGDDDLTDLASLDFPARPTGADLDWLSVPEDLFEAPAREPGGRQTAAADGARARPVVDRQGPARRVFHIALAGAVCVVAALLVARSFGTTRLPSTARTAAARPSPVARTSPPPARASAPPSASPAPRPVTSDAPPPHAPSPSLTAAPAVPAVPTVPATQSVRSEEPSRSGFSVQVAAVPTRDEADRIVTRFVSQGYPAYFVRGDGAAANFYRVRIGAFPDRKAAEDVARKVEGTDGIKPWIAKETPEDKTAASRVVRGDADSNRR